MKILVFGKTGQVARELQRNPGGDEIKALSREEADLSDPAACAALIERSDAQAVINAAAYTAVDQAESEEALATIINAEAPGAMARACAARGLPFCHVSTDYVFDGTGRAPRTPADPVAPQNAYGRSKLKGEDSIRAAGGRYAILRTSWVFSAHGNNFVKTMLRLSETRNALNVVADQIGGPTPAADIATALLIMARAMVAGQGGGLYHFSGAPDANWAEFAREIFARANRNVAVSDIATAAYPTPAARPLNSRLDCATSETDFGVMRPDWKAGLVGVLKELGLS